MKAVMYRKTYLVGVIALFAFRSLPSLGQDASPVLKDGSHPELVTNATVIEMVNAKLPSDVIITKIQASKTNFDLSTAALVKLNESSVPSDVVKAMMQKNTAVEMPAGETPTNPNDPNTDRKSTRLNSSH